MECTESDHNETPTTRLSSFQFPIKTSVSYFCSILQPGWFHFASACSSILVLEVLEKAIRTVMRAFVSFQWKLSSWTQCCLVTIPLTNLFDFAFPTQFHELMRGQYGGFWGHVSHNVTSLTEGNTMLLRDIINGKEKSHLVLVHGECFSPHLLITRFGEQKGCLGL